MFEVGDFVQSFINDKPKGFVWRVDEEGWPCIIQFNEAYLHNMYDVYEHAPSSVEKIRVTKTLKQHGRYYAEYAWKKGLIDNLTYIEILDRLKHHAK